MGGLQILAGLVIACGIATGWIFKDAKESGLKAWPFLTITILTGSIGLLLYLLVRDREPRPKKTMPALKNTKNLIYFHCIDTENCVD